MGTVSPLEIVWTSIAVFGSFYAVRNWLAARGDVHELRRASRNGDLMLVAHQGRRNQFERVFVLGAMLSVGGISMVLPNAPGIYSPPRLAVAAALIALEIRIVYGSFCDSRDRLLLLERDGFQERTEASLKRIEDAGDAGRALDAQVATDLQASRGRADKTEGASGAAADAAAKSGDEK